jgi:hypothetical protein
MRYMMIVKAREGSISPNAELMNAMGLLADEMFKSGVMLDMGGLLPTSQGLVISLSGGAMTVTDGPFAESKEVIGGYAILRADSREEAIAHGKRFLGLHTEYLGESCEMDLEVRPMHEAEEIGGQPECAGQASGEAVAE